MSQAALARVGTISPLALAARPAPAIGAAPALPACRDRVQWVPAGLLPARR